MKLIEAIRWEGDKLAVCIVYADSANDLTDELPNNLMLASGSLAYVANGNVYVFNGTAWAKIGG